VSVKHLLQSKTSLFIIWPFNITDQTPNFTDNKKERKAGFDISQRAKVVFLGDAGVGKVFFFLPHIWRKNKYCKPLCER
jgi:hypothetical protein